VAVDLRRSSEAFGQWVGVTLSEVNKKCSGSLLVLLMAIMF